MIINNEISIAGGDVQGAGNGAANRVAYWTDANTISSNANFTWDNTTLGIALDLKGNEAGNAAAQFVVRNEVTDGSTAISGGSAANTGANVVFYGSTHATKAGDIEFRDSASVVGSYDKSAAFWIWTGVSQYPAGSQSAPSITFQDTDSGVYGVGANRIGISSNGALQADFDDNALGLGRAGTNPQYSLYRSKTDSSLRFAGSSTSGGEFIAYGSAHATLAGLIGIVTTSQTTVGAAGVASALPANPTGYAVLTINGSTKYVVPYYAQA